MIGYKASKAVERVARGCGASEENARVAGMLTATGFVIVGGDPSGLGYIVENEIKDAIASRSGNRDPQK